MRYIAEAVALVAGVVVVREIVGPILGRIWRGRE